MSKRTRGVYTNDEGDYYVRTPYGYMEAYEYVHGGYMIPWEELGGLTKVGDFTPLEIEEERYVGHAFDDAIEAVKAERRQEWQRQHIVTEAADD